MPENRASSLVRSWKEDGMRGAVIVFDGPLDGGTIDSICSDVAADAPDDSVDLDRWRRAIAWVVCDAGRGENID